jgi:pre-mRNA-splicing helicase BRR2
LSFIVPLYEPLPPQYFIKVISDRWLQCETVLPVSFKHLILPEKFSAPTELQDMHSKLVKELGFKEAEDLYLSEGIKEFNAIITQSFNKLYLTDESVFVGAPTGSSIVTCAELAIFKEIQSETFDKIVYMCPVESLCKLRLQDWKKRLGSAIGISVEMLTGNLQQDL